MRGRNARSLIVRLPQRSSVSFSSFPETVGRLTEYYVFFVAGVVPEERRFQVLEEFQSVL